MKKAEARDVRRRIDFARRHAAECYHEPLARAMRLYKGDHWEEGARATGDRITVNYLYAIVETKVAAIAFQHGDWTLKALTNEAKQNEATNRALLDYTFRKGRFLDESRRVFRDFQIGALGIGYTGWKLATGASGTNPAIYEGARPPVAGEARDPTENAGDDQRAALPPKREDRPFLRRIPPADFWVSPETTADPTDAPYLGFTERVPLSTVKKTRKYTGVASLKGTVENLKGFFDEELKSARDAMPEDLRRVELYHYFDRHSLRYAVFAEEREEPIFEGEWPYPYQDRYPFRVMRAPDDENEFWPKPTLLRYEHPQKEINTARSILARHQRQSVPKYQKTGGALSNTAKNQLRSEGQLGVVELEGPEKLDALPRLPVQMEIFQSVEAAGQDIQFLAAMNAYEAFAEPGKRLTSAEVAAIQGQGAARAKAEQQAYEAFVAGVGQDTLQYLQSYTVATQDLPIFKGGEVVEIRPFSLEEIRGEYWVEVYVGSTTAPNRKALADQLGLLMQSAPNMMQAVMAGTQAGIDLRQLFRQILEGVPEIRNVERIVPDQGGLTGGGVPPEALAMLLGQQGGQMALPAAGGQEALQPTPGIGPDGSIADIPATDAWLRGMSDEDLAEYAGFLYGGA